MKLYPFPSSVGLASHKCPQRVLMETSTCPKFSPQLLVQEQLHYTHTHSCSLSSSPLSLSCVYFNPNWFSSSSTCLVDNTHLLPWVRDYKKQRKKWKIEQLAKWGLPSCLRLQFPVAKLLKAMSGKGSLKDHSRLKHLPPPPPSIFSLPQWKSLKTQMHPIWNWLILLLFPPTPPNMIK